MAQEMSTGVNDMSLDQVGEWMWDTAKLAFENVPGLYRIEIYVRGGAGPFPEAMPSSRFAPAVHEIRAFRAEVFYAGGRRPGFQAPDGSFTDREAADWHSCHVVCRNAAGEVVGCLRLTPAEHAENSAVLGHLGQGWAAELRREHKIDQHRMWEAGRLAVSAGQRRQGVAAVILLAALALGRRISRPVIWATSGERDGQHRYFTRFGAWVLPESSQYVAKYEDNVCVVIHDQRRFGPLAHQAMDMAEAAITERVAISEAER